jgi:hypothetical protein
VVASFAGGTSSFEGPSRESGFGSLDRITSSLLSLYRTKASKVLPVHTVLFTVHLLASSTFSTSPPLPPPSSRTDRISLPIFPFSRSRQFQGPSPEVQLQVPVFAQYPSAPPPASGDSSQFFSSFSVSLGRALFLLPASAGSALLCCCSFLPVVAETRGLRLCP